MKNNYLINMLTFLVLLNTNLFASQAIQEIDDFESLLENVSSIATKKSLNVDYLPSVVTVINAQTYRDAGIQNIGEALNMLPGIQMQINRMGYNTTTVRGLKSPNAYRSDKIKVLIDGVAINNEAQGSSSLYMDFPMQLVEKIEVLRGPGSTVYGAGAFYATINVITKTGAGKKNGEVFIGTGSYENKTISTNIYEKLGKDWEVYADVYHKENDKHIKLPTGFSDFGTQTDEAMKDLTASIKLTNENFEFLTRYKENTYGNFYGYEENLDEAGKQDREHTNSYLSMQLLHNISYNDFNLETKLNYSKRTLDASANFYSPKWAEGKFAVVDINMTDGYWYSESSIEENIEAEAILSLPSIYSNDILLGGGVRKASMIKDEFFNPVEDTIIANRSAIENHPSYNSDTLGRFRFRESKEPDFWANQTTTMYKKNLNRTILYAYVQDLISVNKSIDIALGLRLDHYSDFGLKMSKRAALVYRATEKSIFKALYGSAFRAPTFSEKYNNGHLNFRIGNTEILPEETDTYELQYIYISSLRSKFSLNAFYAELFNVIGLEEDPEVPGGYQNFDFRTSKGVEIEYNFKTKLIHNFYLNATYVDTTYTLPQDGDTPEINMGMPDISQVMLKAMYVYTPISQLSFGTTWRYESEITPNKLSDNDGALKEQHIFDETITYRMSSASKLRLTIKNVLDSEIKNPSYYYEHKDGILREGRNFFLNYIHTF